MTGCGETMVTFFFFIFASNWSTSQEENEVESETEKTSDQTSPRIDQELIKTLVWICRFI